MLTTIRIFFVSILLSSLVNEYSRADDGMEKSLFDQKKITVVITDSGLGGLSVLDDISKKLAGSGYYKKVDLIFVNALFNADFGYNALASREAKIDTLNTVLYGIEKKFHPDIILIGCNTLSVFFTETEFVKESNTPVTGIVNSGVGLISDHLSQNENSSVIITGTKTTISEDSHRKALLAKGYSEDRIITKACPELQSYIEQDPDGESTEMLISIYMEEALAELPENTASLFLSLNCSHFAYSEELWRQTFNHAGVDLEKILNPNTIMGDFLMPEKNRGRFRKTKITHSVYSRVLINNVRTMHSVFKDNSPNVAKALNNYIIDRDLF
ncbi:hypothetical protein ACFLTU_07150 [Bacteroidota bacterium]